jgi:DNA-binding response OmpR family regulator
MKKVLITEDDALMAEIYRDSFEREGFSAEIAADGAIAIQCLKGNPPDLVLLDLMMPNINGVEVLKHIRAQESTRLLPVIVMSNALAGTLGKQAASAGATRMFAKNACGPKRLVKEARDVLATIPSPTESASSSADPTKPIIEFRKNVTGGMPQRLAEIRDLLQSIATAGQEIGQKELLNLHRAIHQLAGTLSFAGFSAMAQLACALETLFKEFYGTPKRINRSSLRTASQGVEVLAELSESSARSSEDVMSPSLVLVVDDEPLARETTCTALEQTHLRTVSVDNPILAFRLAEENHFDLIVMDVELPGMDGFRACLKIQETRANSGTPVIILTTHDDVHTRVRFNSCGAADFIAKPIWFTELGVKALTHLSRPKKS